MLHNDFLVAWEKYLSDIGADERVVYDRTFEEGLRFLDYIERDTEDSQLRPENYLSKGVHAVDVPHGFREKIDSGDIRLVLGDIAAVNLPPEHDFTSCRNVVLYMLDPHAQMLAVANLVASTKVNGVVLVNDVGQYYGTPLFKGFIDRRNKIDGWLDDDKAEILGVRIEKVESDPDSTSIDYLLHKTASTFEFPI